MGKIQRREKKNKMKRRGVLSAVGVAIILLLIMAFILPPVVSAADLEIECQPVTPNPGYYNENFTYSVEIRNNHPLFRQDIKRTTLRIYPSKNATVYHQRRNSTTIEIPSMKSETVSFKVRLSDSNVYNDLRRDSEYQEWLGKDSSSEWTQLWYKFYVEPKKGGDLECRGEGPILRKCLNVPDCGVTPIQGYVTDNFSYTVRIEKDENVNATLPDVRVSLYTYPNEDNDAVFCIDTNESDMEDNDKSVTFDNISVTRGCFMGDEEYRDWLENSSDISPWTRSKYRFEVEWRGEVHDECEKFDQEIQKPIFNCYDPLKVNYNATKCNFISEISERGLMPFDFTAKVKIAERDDNVTLKVANYTSSDEWDDKSFANYTSKSQKNETLDWHANLSKHNLETIEIDSSRPPIYKLIWDISYTFYSPKIHRPCDYPEHPPNFIPHKRLEGTVESSVSPGEGTYNNTYTYNLLVKWPICDVFELQVRNYEKGGWDTMEKLNYTTPNIDQSFTPPINLTSDHFSKERDGQYRFVSKVLNENFTFPGPIWTINLTSENITFSPKTGLYDSVFNFSMDVKANKNLTVKLFTRCPDGLEKDKSTKYIAPGWQHLNWSVRPCENESTGTVKYWFEFWYKSDQLNRPIRVKRIPVDVTETLPGPSVWHAVFKNETVDPEIEDKQTLFDYSVYVKTVNIPGEVCLWIQKPDGGWKDSDECMEYSNPGSWQLIHFDGIDVWDLVNKLDLMHYQFKFYDETEELRGKSEIFSGPELIKEKIENLTATPKKGTNSTPFTFCVDVNSTKKENVMLQVRSNETKWMDVTSKLYENVSNEKHICFSDVSVDSSNLTPEEKKNLTSEWKKNKTIFWRVKGIIRESNTISTDWDINLTCHDRTFSPKEGWWYQDNFTFQVNLSAEMNGDVELRIKLNESNSNWTTVGKREYNNSPNPQILTWENVSISANITYEGNTSYNFTLLWDSREDSCGSEHGPRLFIPIDIQFKNASVTPKVGIYYIENDILWTYFKNRNTNYTYCVNVSAAKDTRIRPVIIDPTDKRTRGSERNYSTETNPEKLCWTINLSAPENICWGMWNYTFEYFDTREENETGDGWVEWENQSEGPEHIAVFKNFDIDPKPPLLYGESCNVSVVVNGSKNFNITLELCNSTTCKPVKTKTYNSSKGEDPMPWNGIKPWENFSSSDKLLFNFNVSGEPSIKNVSNGFSMLPAAQNHKVTPGDGYWDTSYNYSVEIKFDGEIDVELWILKRGGEYYKGSPKRYKKGTHWEPIYWNVEPFDQGCEMWKSQFNVTWNGTPLYIREAGELKPIKIYGPYIWDRPPGVKFREGEVSMQEATYEDKLNYSVEVSVEPIKDVEVALWVYDPCYGDRFMGYGHHSGSEDGWQKFTWSNKMPFYDERCKVGHSEFWFKAYDRHDKFINESQKWEGPDLIPLIEFSDARVTPKDGKYNACYNYSVNITINRSKLVDINDIKLVVWNPSTNSEQEYPSGNVTDLSDGTKKIWWSETPFKNDASCRGTAKYYFDYNGDIWPEKVLCDGPTIGVSTSTSSSSSSSSSYGRSEKIYDNASVEPDPVEMGIRRESRMFNYSVEETKGYKLILEVYNVSSGKWEEKGEGVKSKHNGKWKHEWTVNLTLDCNWEGRGKYRFYPEKQGKYASQVYYGPDYELPEGSTDIWKKDIPVSDTCLHKPNINANVEPKKGMWFKKFTYTAEIMHPDKADMTVVLFVYKPESDDWGPVAKGRRYNYIINTSDYDEHNKATVTWTANWGNVFDEDDAGKWSRFHIWYWDGWNEADCEKSEREGYDEGPEILANGEPQVAKLPEFNYVGSTSTEFEYSFDVSDDNNDTVYGLLTVIDPLNNSHSLSKVEKTGNNGVASFCFTVNPDSEIFTEDKLKQYKNKTGNDTFTSRYRLEYWDECREMMGIGKRVPTDWSMGPTVTAVKVNYTEPPEVSPNRGTYADEFEIRIEFYSSKTNTIRNLTLTIYDPSNRSPSWSPPGGVVDLKVPAGQTEPVSWRVKPEIFGPEDAGKYVNYTIEGTDSFERVYKINGNGSELYIERAVPLLSLDPPLVPLVSMVIVPTCVVLYGFLAVLLNVGGKLKGIWKQRIRKEGKGE